MLSLQSTEYRPDDPFSRGRPLDLQEDIEVKSTEMLHLCCYTYLWAVFSLSPLQLDLSCAVV